MATQQWQLVPLFQKFIDDSYKGKRLKPNGKMIKKQTVDNYTYVLKHLKEYEKYSEATLRILAVTGVNKRFLSSERNYWKKFYLKFTYFLLKHKGCYDNYTGGVMKVVKTFFNYLKKEKFLPIGDFQKQFYVMKEDIDVISLLPGQLQFLIHNKTFHDSLSPSLRQSKQVMVLGCTVALRASDLFSIRFSDIEKVGDKTYLAIRSAKMDVSTRMRLPAYALDVIEDFRRDAKKRKTLLPPLSINQFNKNIRGIAEKAGWNMEKEKLRSKRGKLMEIRTGAKRTYRFCDLMSSHVMRRTAITTMLMLGMPEHVVKKISGHAANSKAFYRYVNFVQPYLDGETEKVFNQLSMGDGQHM